MKLKLGYNLCLMINIFGLRVSMTTVINITDCPDFNPNENETDVYIGTFHTSSEYGFFPKSKWHNPYKEADYGKSTSIEMYRRYILKQCDLMNALLPELKGKRLGCWCKPLQCHGDVLVELIDRNHSSD